MSTPPFETHAFETGAFETRAFETHAVDNQPPEFALTPEDAEWTRSHLGIPRGGGAE